ncbi:MAG: LptF/LptG family permease [Salibacteraceae bacterium]
MKRIDWYIIRKFLSTFFFILGIIMLIAVIFDVSEKLDDFLKHNTPIGEILLDYYLNFVLYFGNLFSSLLIFISVIIFTSQMASKTEIVAILSSGVSFRRMLLPYFVAGTFLAIGSLLLNHYVIPRANKQRLAFEELYIRSKFQNRDKNIHRRINDNDVIYFYRYNADRNVGQKFSLEHWENDVLTYKLSADFLKWDSTRQGWTIENYVARTIHPDGEVLTRGQQIDTVFNFKPIDFERRLNTTETMDANELDAFIDQEREKGSENIPTYLITKYQRTSYPFATYVLVLIGASIASRKVRGGIGLHIVLGLLVAVSYILMMKVTTVYATNAGLDPLLAVWLPNIIYGVLSLIILQRAPK